MTKNVHIKRTPISPLHFCALRFARSTIFPTCFVKDTSQVCNTLGSQACRGKKKATYDCNTETEQNSPCECVCILLVFPDTSSSLKKRTKETLVHCSRNEVKKKGLIRTERQKAVARPRAQKGKKES